jgi:hypothetical protein
MRRRRSLIPLALVALVAVGCAGAAAHPLRPVHTASVPAQTALEPPLSVPPSSSTAATRPPTTRRSPRPARTIAPSARISQQEGSSAAEVASRFAAAYARYLDGVLPASRLPASPKIRHEVGRPLPAGARRGRLTVRSVKPYEGKPTFFARLANRAHSFDVQITVRRVHGREMVVQLVPPDFDVVLRPRAVPHPPGSGRAERAVRTFFKGYLPWVYGHGPVSAIHDATPALLASFRAHPLNVPPGIQSLKVRLTALSMERKGSGWKAFATIDSGAVALSVTAELVRVKRRWLVSSVAFPE